MRNVKCQERSEALNEKVLSILFFRSLYFISFEDLQFYHSIFLSLSNNSQFIRPYFLISSAPITWTANATNFSQYFFKWGRIGTLEN